MKRALIGLVVGAIWACTSSAQTTYPMDKSPFRCQAVTQAQIHLAFSQFNCRGIFYNNGDVEVIFNGQYNSIEVFSRSGGWTAYGTVSLLSFNQPNPYFCPLKEPGNIAGCPDGTTPGDFSFTWTATDSADVVHTGSISGTWENVQYMGGTKAWYYPVLETAPLTIDGGTATIHPLYPCGSKRKDCLHARNGYWIAEAVVSLER